MAHPDGLFAWTDLAVPNVPAAKAFYEGVLGWVGEEQFDGEGNLIYVIFSKDGDMAAGLGPLPPEMEFPGHPPMWTSYVKVSSVDDTVAAALAAGGSVVAPAMDVTTAGRMAILADPTGAVFALWQPGDHGGADRFNDPGFMTWNELLTRDVAAAKAFYGEVFGWTYQTSDEAGFEYISIELGDRANGGIMAMGSQWPAEIPPHWMVYFRVADADAAVKDVADLGGSVSIPPFDTPAGRAAVVGDPLGGTFSVIGPDPNVEA